MVRAKPLPAALADFLALLESAVPDRYFRIAMGTRTQ